MTTPDGHTTSTADSAGDKQSELRSQETFARLLRQDVAPTLRTWGFRGSGQTYELRDEKTWAVLGFQRSRYSRADELEFTVNVVVVGKDAWASRREAYPKLGKRPAPSDVTHAGALRVDQISADAGDVWWVVRPASDTREVSREVLETLAEHVLPWLHNRLGRADTSIAGGAADADGDANDVGAGEYPVAADIRGADDEPLLV